MRTWADFLLVILLFGGFACGVAGYAICVRHVWPMPDRKDRLKTLFFKFEDFQNYPPAGTILIGIMALCGVIVFCGFGGYLLISIYTQRR